MNTKVIGVLFLICSVACAADTGYVDDAARGAPYDFRGLALGMTLSQFKHAKAPIAGAGAKLACETPLNADEAARHLIRCAWTESGPDGRIRKSPLVLGDVLTRNYAFIFSASGGKREMRLREIDIVGPVDARGRIFRRLMDRFGEPCQPYVDDNNMVAIWSNAVSRIVLRSSVVDGKVRVRFTLRTGSAPDCSV